MIEQPLNDQQANRGGCLTAWLVLLIIGSASAAISSFFISDVFESFISYTLADQWVFIAWGCVALLQLVSAVALMLWKRWGFFGLCGAAVVSIGLEIYLGFPIYFYIGNLVAPLILFLLMKPQWNDFR